MRDEGGTVIAGFAYEPDGVAIGVAIACSTDGVGNSMFAIAAPSAAPIN